MLCHVYTWNAHLLSFLVNNDITPADDFGCCTIYLVHATNKSRFCLHLRKNGWKFALLALLAPMKKFEFTFQQDFSHQDRWKVNCPCNMERVFRFSCHCISMVLGLLCTLRQLVFLLLSIDHFLLGHNFFCQAIFLFLQNSSLFENEK